MRFAYRQKSSVPYGTELQIRIEHIKIEFAVWGKGYVADTSYWNHFLSITIALLALQPSPRSDRFVAPVVSEAPEAPVVKKIAAKRTDTNLITAPITIPKPVDPKPILAEVNAPRTPTTV